MAQASPGGALGAVVSARAPEGPLGPYTFCKGRFCPHIADAVIIARPFVTAVYGGGEEGVASYIKKITGELEDTMSMCGAFSLAEIDETMIYRP